MTKNLLISKLGSNVHLLLRDVPHNEAIGLELVAAEPYRVIVKVPYAERLVGNPDTGVLHGGVITTMLDAASGIACLCAMEELVSIATLDLRIDYMKPAEPRRDLLGRAHCYKMTRNIAFVRGVAYHEDPAEPIATSVASFMLSANAANRHERLMQLIEQTSAGEGG